MSQVSQANARHWFKVNVLYEIPVASSFFKMDTWSLALHDAGKCVFSLVGGNIAIEYVLLADDTDPQWLCTLKMTTNMVVGMAVGKVIYNGLCNGGSMLYQYLACSHTANYQSIATNTEQDTATPITALNHFSKP